MNGSHDNRFGPGDPPGPSPGVSAGWGGIRRMRRMWGTYGTYVPPFDMPRYSG